MARQLVESGLDGAVLIVGPNGSMDRFFEVQEEVGRITADAALQMELLMGAELTVGFNGGKYHILCVLPDAEARPDIPGRQVHMRILEDFAATYDTGTLAAHPTVIDGWHNKAVGATEELLQHPRIHGAELVNGAVYGTGIPEGWTKITAFQLITEARKTRGGVFAVTGGSDSPRKNVQIGDGVTRFDKGTGGLIAAIQEGRTHASSIRDEVRAKISIAAAEAIRTGMVGEQNLPLVVER